MDGLRWLLLLFGLLVIAGVYFYSRREKYSASDDDGEPAKAQNGVRMEPSLGGSDTLASGEETEYEAREEVGGATAAGEAAPAQKIVTLRIVAADSGTFAGDELVLSLRGIGMRHGKFGIFHRYEGSDEEQVVFSAASLVEPGSFDLTNIKEQKIPGISLFMVLPGPIDGAEAFDLMMTAARTLSQSLKAELLDESGSTLSIQRERYLREEIIQYQHGILVA